VSRAAQGHKDRQARPLSEPVVRVDDLHVEIVSRKTKTEILCGVSLSLWAGEMHGLVGETGSGKSMTARAIMGVLPRGGRVTGGRILLKARDLVCLDEKALCEIRGSQIGMIFQDPRSALFPFLSIEKQMGNVLRAHHRSLTKLERGDRIREYLKLAGIPDTQRVARAYPHELSGGMAQRVVIAAVLISEPEIVIADEPTTGLDATIQRQILELLAEIQDRLGLSVLLITHDLAIVAQYCDSVTVMHDGMVVEQGSMRQVLLAPEAKYTRRLIAASRLQDLAPRA
jgi:ABC-type dipeptide/oligopeptide/nickel transport system ATPase component